MQSNDSISKFLKNWNEKDIQDILLYAKLVKFQNGNIERKKLKMFHLKVNVILQIKKYIYI